MIYVAETRKVASVLHLGAAAPKPDNLATQCVITVRQRKNGHTEE